MRLLYIFHRQNSEPHPFHVESTWMPQVQHSVALESYLENVKTQFAKIKITKPKRKPVTHRGQSPKGVEKQSCYKPKKKKKTKGQQQLSRTRQTKRARSRCNSITESTMSISKRQWWKPCRKRLMTSVADYTKANTLTTWLRNGFYKLRLESQNIPHMYKNPKT